MEQTVSVRDLRIRLTLTPGAAGDNGYEAYITRANQGIEGLAVTLRVVFPSLDRRSRMLTLDDSGDGIYSSAGLELNRAGEWSALVDVIAPDGTSSRAAFAFDIPAEIPEVATRQATLVNWLAALAVLAVLGGWLRPSVMRWLQRVQWRPAYVLLGAATLIVVVIFSVISWQALDETSKQRDRLANPLPAVINLTRPDDASLQRGIALFAARCASCHTEDSLRRTFAPRRLAELRDEQLFTIIIHGKDGIPPVTLSEAERWDVINYLRSAPFERRTLR
jgi:mono/diheme cytochrome c family protein